jgi:CheY-like chemotaxis protein
MGIDAEVLPHIFERFWQADRSTVRKHGGLGLGLAIVKYMVERHGGAIQVDSAGENSGTTFVINLPIATAARRTGPGGLRPSRSAVAAAAARLDLAGLRVLLVDDDFGTRDVVARLLEDGGAEVRMASSAHQALQALRERCPDVLISDIGLPEMDGYALIREVRGSDAKPGLPGCGELPALALTAYAGAEARARAFDAGYNAHVVKPVDSDNLLSAVLALVPAADPAHARDGIPASRDSVAQEQRDCALPTSCADPVAQPKTTSTR